MTDKNEQSEAEQIARLWAHVEYQSEVIDVLRCTLADLLPSGAAHWFGTQLREQDTFYRNVKKRIDARFIAPKGASRG